LVPERAAGGPAIVSASVEAASMPGAQRLRLVVAPAGLDVGSLSPAELATAAPNLTLVDLRYEVKRP
jgi:hypothetical protein